MRERGSVSLSGEKHHLIEASPWVCVEAPCDELFMGIWGAEVSPDSTGGSAV